MGDYVFNGLSPEATQAISSFISSKYDELWMEVEDKTAKILSHFQPSRASEERRKVVIDYVEGLIEREFDCKVKIHPLILYDFSTQMLLLFDSIIEHF